MLLAFLPGCDGPEDKKARFLAEGRAHYDAGRYEMARGKFRSVAQIDPRSAEAQWMLGRIGLHQGRVEAARQRLLRAVALDPGNLAARLELGTYYLGMRDLPRAQEQAAAIAARESGHPGGRLLAAAAAVAGGRAEEAAQELDRLVAERVGLPAAYALRADLLQARGAAAEALASLAAGIRRLPHAVSLHLMLGRLLADDGRFQAAAAVMGKVSAMDPERLEHRLALAGLLRLAGQGDEADVVVDELVAARAGDTEAVRVIARHCAAEGLGQRAMGVLRVGLEAAPGHPGLEADLAALAREMEAAVPSALRPPGHTPEDDPAQGRPAAAGQLLAAGLGAGPRTDPLVAALAGYAQPPPAAPGRPRPERTEAPVQGPETGPIPIALWLLGLGLLGLVAVRRKVARKR